MGLSSTLIYTSELILCSTVEIKLRFHDGLVWTVGLTVEIQAAFLNFSCMVWTGSNSPKSTKTVGKELHFKTF